MFSALTFCLGTSLVHALIFGTNVMRPLNFILTVSVFGTLLFCLALASAVVTKAVHEQIASRHSVAAPHSQ